MDKHKILLLENKAWAKEQKLFDPDFFKRMSHSQTPFFLWIGCSDSRVPANEITGTEPGDIFVHRNIANLVNGNDLNLMSVVSYAVNYLKVKHIIICGHHNCGGIQAALSKNDFGNTLNGWLQPLKDLCESNKSQLTFMPESQRLNWMVEQSVRQQVFNLSQTDVIQNAWTAGQELAIHGWVYQLGDGLLKDICDTSSNINSREQKAV